MYKYTMYKYEHNIIWSLHLHYKDELFDRELNPIFPKSRHRNSHYW